MAKYQPMSPEKFAAVLAALKANRAAEKNPTYWDEDEAKRKASDEFLARVEADRRQKSTLLAQQRHQAFLTRTEPLEFVAEI